MVIQNRDEDKEKLKPTGDVPIPGVGVSLVYFDLVRVFLHGRYVLPGFVALRVAYVWIWWERKTRLSLWDDWLTGHLNFDRIRNAHRSRFIFVLQNPADRGHYWHWWWISRSTYTSWIDSDCPISFTPFRSRILLKLRPSGNCEKGWVCCYTSITWIFGNSASWLVWSFPRRRGWYWWIISYHLRDWASSKSSFEHGLATAALRTRSRLSRISYNPNNVRICWTGEYTS